MTDNETTTDAAVSDEPTAPTDGMEEADTFPREYVERLRTEAAEHRTAARSARDALEPVQARLHGLLVAATGRLADPTDLPFDTAHLDGDDALNAAIDDLLARKPHLATRRVRGEIGQGDQGTTASVDLAGLLRSGAA